MKNFKIYFCFLFYISMFSQSSWTILPSNTTNHLSDITFSSATHGFIVGENGTILKTTDTGSTWYSVFAASSDYFKSVSFYDDTTGFVLSNQNLYKTSDGGDNWLLVYTSETSSLNVVFFVTPNIGFIGTDASILKTVDGGQNWSSQPVANPINSISFPNPTTGYFVGGTDVSSLLYKTDNQGLTYSTQNILMQCIKERVFFINENIGYIIGWYSPLIKKTSDGGQTWVYLSDELGGMEINFLDEENGYYIQNSGGLSKINSTTDGGNNWTEELSISANNSLYGLTKMTIKNSSAYVVGGNGLIYKKSVQLNSNENNKKKNIILFSNPVKNGELNISYDKYQLQIKEITIVNNLGSELITLKNNIEKINVSNLSEGVYYLKFDTDSGIVTKKMIIRK